VIIYDNELFTLTYSYLDVSGAYDGLWGIGEEHCRYSREEKELVHTVGINEF